MMEIINNEGISLCEKAYDIARNSKHNFEHAFLDPEFMKVYSDFELWAFKNGLTGKDELLSSEKFLAYVKLYGKDPISHVKTFSSIRRNNSRVCQTRTTMIKGNDGKALTMPEKTLEVARDILIKGVAND